MDNEQNSTATNSDVMGDDELIGTKVNITGDEAAEKVEMTKTISHVRKFTFEGDNKPKKILVFTDGRELALNATREEQLAEIVGTKVGELRVSAVKGVAVKIYAAKVKDPSGKKVNSAQLGKAVAF